MTDLRTAAQQAQEPVGRDDGMPTSAEERHLRRLLALRAAMPHTYYDDGEAQGIEHGISIDFMREPAADIDAKLRALNVARAIAKQEPAFHGFMSADGTRVDLCFTPSSPRSDGTYATAYYTAPPQHPAEPLTGCDGTCCQPVQEPVAWMTVRLNVPIQTTARKDVADEWLKWGEVQPLYPAPPQRKPLSEEEIRDLLEAEFLGGYGNRNLNDDLQVFRLAESAHGIKE